MGRVALSYYKILCKIMESNLLKDDGMTVQNIEFRGMQEADTISKETSNFLYILSV